MDGEIFEYGKKKLRIQKYPDTCHRCSFNFFKSCKNNFTSSYIYNLFHKNVFINIWTENILICECGDWGNPNVCWR